MADLICPLYDTPKHQNLLDELVRDGITIRSARAWENAPLSEFIHRHFGQRWADETARAFMSTPITVIIALHEKAIVGFAAYEVTARTYFGPTGVDEAYRNRGIGKALLYEALDGLKNLGYVYGIIGSPGPIDFYTKATKCLLLPSDWTTIYTGTD